MKIIKKIKEINNSIKGFSTLSFATLINNLVGAIFWFLIASIVGSNGYGEISYFIAIATSASRISMIGTTNTLLVYIPKGIRLQPPIFVIVGITSILSSIIVYLFFLQKFEISIFIIGFAIFNLIINDALGRKIYREYAKYIISQKILVFTLAFIFYFLIGIDGVILGIGISFLPYFFILKKLIFNSKIDFSILKDKKKFMLNNYLIDIAGSFNGSLDKLIIAPLFGFVLLGNFQLAQQFFLVLMILPYTVFQYILPHDASGNSNKLLKKLILIFSIISAVIGILLVPLIISQFFNQFESSSGLIQIISIQIIPATIITIYSSKFLANGKSNIVLYGMVIFIITEISLIYGLEKTFNIYGVAIALAVASTFYAIYLLILNKIIKMDEIK